MYSGVTVSMPEAACSSAMAEAPLNDEPDFSTFENKSGLAEDMKFLASMPELCDVTFLVGDTREPVCAVKAVLAARSRVFHKMLYQTPSPQRKKEAPPKENKLRLFLKRSSEPLLNLQNAAQQRGFSQQLAPIQEGGQHSTLMVEEFEPDVFRQLIEYIHTGSVTLQPRTLLGVMNAADYYGLDELRRACAGFVQCCINVDTVCALLASAERYIQYKCTKSLVQKVLEFVDEHGNEVLNLGSFTLLPQHVVRLILCRDELRADEFTKFQAALMWGKKYCDSNPNTPLKDVIGNFLEYIQFHKIPANVLMREVHPLGLVPYSIIMNALAYQADPTSVDPGKLSPNRVRRSAHGRSMSVQSSLDPYGSNTTLSSSGSSEMKREDGVKKDTEEDEERENNGIKFIKMKLDTCASPVLRQDTEEEMGRKRDDEEKEIKLFEIKGDTRGIQVMKQESVDTERKKEDDGTSEENKEGYQYDIKVIGSIFDIANSLLMTQDSKEVTKEKKDDEGAKGKENIGESSKDKKGKKKKKKKPDEFAGIKWKRPFHSFHGRLTSRDGHEKSKERKDFKITGMKLDAPDHQFFKREFDERKKGVSDVKDKATNDTSSEAKDDEFKFNEMKLDSTVGSQVLEQKEEEATVTKVDGDRIKDEDTADLIIEAEEDYIVKITETKLESPDIKVLEQMPEESPERKTDDDDGVKDIAGDDFSGEYKEDNEVLVIEMKLGAVDIHISEQRLEETIEVKEDDVDFDHIVENRDLSKGDFDEKQASKVPEIKFDSPDSEISEETLEEDTGLKSCYGVKETGSDEYEEAVNFISILLDTAVNKVLKQRSEKITGKQGYDDETEDMNVEQDKYEGEESSDITITEMKLDSPEQDTKADSEEITVEKTDDEHTKDENEECFDIEVTEIKSDVYYSQVFVQEPEEFMKVKRDSSLKDKHKEDYDIVEIVEVNLDASEDEVSRQEFQKDIEKTRDTSLRDKHKEDYDIVEIVEVNLDASEDEVSRQEFQKDIEKTRDSSLRDKHKEDYDIVEVVEVNLDASEDEVSRKEFQKDIERTMDSNLKDKHKEDYDIVEVVEVNLDASEDEVSRKEFQKDTEKAKDDYEVKNMDKAESGIEVLSMKHEAASGQDMKQKSEETPEKKGRINIIQFLKNMCKRHDSGREKEKEGTVSELMKLIPSSSQATKQEYEAAIGEKKEDDEWKGSKKISASSQALKKEFREIIWIEEKDDGFKVKDEDQEDNYSKVIGMKLDVIRTLSLKKKPEEATELKEDHSDLQETFPALCITVPVMRPPLLPDSSGSFPLRFQQETLI